MQCFFTRRSAFDPGSHAKDDRVDISFWWWCAKHWKSAHHGIKAVRPQEKLVVGDVESTPSALQ